MISDYNISEIATLCAYSNISHFSKSFKQHFSTTPTQFRKLHRKK
ncbi:MAG: AraC family transcriptional regulator [Alistipes sp.]|nr:AraC family transcriptional regulator [Alistipes sp.]MBQ6870321.1 AraC family transcriptional regulator [Alistipes sp.]